MGCSIEDSKIVQLALNSYEDILAAATDDGQILTFFYKVPGLLEVRKWNKISPVDVLSVGIY